MSRTVLVTGATGSQGGAVARALLDRGFTVRALTRDPGSDAARVLAGLGAEVVAGDFEDADSLHGAATGTDAVFAMGTFEVDVETETRQGIALLDAVHAAGTGHIVYTSVASALGDTGIPHFESKAEVERHLATLDVPWTVLAPVAYLENLTSPWVAPGLREGRYEFGVPADVSLQQVALADLAALVAVVVTDPERFRGERIEVASTDLTGVEIAARLSPLVGREIRYVEVPGDRTDEDLQAMLDFFRRGGYTVDIPALRAAYPQVEWHDFDDWATARDWSETRSA